MPIVLARSLVRLLFYFKLTRIAGFIAKHYRINDLDILPAYRSEARFVNDGSQISQLLYFLGTSGYEDYELDIWIHLCKNAKSICEIGGNIGYFTIFGANAAPLANYSVYEPNPISIRSLNSNVLLNSLKNVTVIEAAVVGDSLIKTITLHIPVQETGKQATGAYIDNSEGIDRPSIESFSVPTTYGGDITGFDLLKLDVEGSEHHILSAMENTLNITKPIIMIEVRRRTPKLREWITRFAKINGYQIWAMSHPVLSLVPIEKIMNVILQETYGTRDLLLIPPGHEEILRKLS